MPCAVVRALCFRIGEIDYSKKSLSQSRDFFTVQERLFFGSKIHIPVGYSTGVRSVIFRTRFSFFVTSGHEIFSVPVMTFFSLPDLNPEETWFEYVVNLYHFF